MADLLSPTTSQTGGVMRVSHSKQADNVLVHAMRPASDGYMQASDLWFMQLLKIIVDNACHVELDPSCHMHQSGCPPTAWLLQSCPKHLAFTATSPHSMACKCHLSWTSCHLRNHKAGCQVSKSYSNGKYPHLYDNLCSVTRLCWKANS